MKILLTGGGTAGHFYPLIAVAEALNRIAEREKLVKAELFYLSTTPYDKKLLYDNDITFRRIFAGKIRRYFSLWNVVDVFPMALGIFKALASMYIIYPDVVVSKGGYASVPVVFAARILRIPVIVHESDSRPGRANKWAARFARRVAVSWPEAAEYFPQEKTAVTGQPIRKDIKQPAMHGAREYLKIEESVPVILVLGGSQGARRINEAVLDILPRLLESYAVIHQTGPKNIDEIQKMKEVILSDSKHKARYKPFGYLDTLAIRMSAGAASLVISRAGSGIFEIAAWRKPSIIIPIAESGGGHQRQNAFNYARSGACVVVEEKNLTPNVLFAEIRRLMASESELKRMADAAKSFFQDGADEKIAREAISIALEHEQ